MKSTSSLLLILLTTACDRRGDAREVEQLESYRARYGKVIATDFPNSLFSPEVDQILGELRTFSASKDMIAEARGLAEQIEADRRRFGRAGPEARSAQELLANAVSSKPKAVALQGKDDREQIWLNALMKGTSLAGFDRYWRPCFRRDAQDSSIFHRTGIRPCMVRSHYQEIQSVRFRSGKIHELIPRVSDPVLDGGPQ